MEGARPVGRKGTGRLSGLALLLLGLALAGDCSAQEAAAPPGKPLWEAGVFAGAVRLPHYRGSDQYKVYAWPLPFFIYRGEVLQSDREGLRGIFYRSERVETTMSFFGNPPTGGDNRARRDMPGLHAIGEAGPAAKFFFRRGPDVYLLAAVRGAAAVDPSHWLAHWVGLRAGPSLVLSDYEPVPGGRWNFGLTAGVDFTDRHYNAYFYDVARDQAAPGRAEYHSRGGYAGSSLSGYAEVKLMPRLTWAAYARWDNVDGAVYQASPLVRTANNYVVGSAVIWTLRQSKRQAPGPR